MRKNRPLLKMKILPFSPQQFVQTKNKVFSQVVRNEKYRCSRQLPHCQTAQPRRSLSHAPSSLHSQFSYIKSPQRHSISVEPCVKLKKTSITRSYNPPQNYVFKMAVNIDLKRFRKILHQQVHLCKTCQVDKRFRPQIFKKDR